MNPIPKTIRLDFILDYCIFSGQAVYICPSDNPDKKAIFIIFDLGAKIFKAKLASSHSPEDILDVFSNKDLIVYTQYLSRTLTFHSKLCPLEVLDNPESAQEFSEKNFFIFEKPPKGELKNARPNRRFSLVAENQLKVELHVVSPVGSTHFMSEHLFDVSLETLALFLDRAKGLVLPGDEVSKLVLYKDGKPVLETQGQIVRCDLSQKSHAGENLYFVVIRFQEPASQKQEALPIQGTQRQRTQRLSFLEDQNAFVDGPHPFLEGFQIYGTVYDISLLGLSFDVKKTVVPIIPGAVFHEFFIQLPHQRIFEVAIRVVYVKTLEDKKYSYRIGAEFIHYSNEFLKAVSQIKQRYLDERFVDASFEDQERLWLFFFESKFIYREKREQLQGYADKIKNTYFKILKKNSPIIKQILFKEEDEIKGCIAALKFFDHTWMVQHLQGKITADQTHSGMVLVQALTDFFLESKNNKRGKSDFFTFFYRPENVFPNTVFGEVAKRLGNASICDTRDLSFCLVNTEGGETRIFPPEIKRIQCREANPQDLKKLEAILVSQREYMLLRTEGLSFENILRLEISKDFSDLGLYRYRKVFLVFTEQEDSLVYAICDFSSPGLNFSELTNRIKLIYSNPQSGSNIFLANHLCKQVLDIYAQTEMPNPVLLLSANQTVPFPFLKKKIYRHFFLDLRYIKDFKTQLDFILKDIKILIKEYSNHAVKNNGHETPEHNDIRLVANAQ
jgi:hypothetical protein